MRIAIHEAITHALSEWAEKHGYAFRHSEAHKSWAIYLVPKPEQNHSKHLKQAIKRWYNDRLRYDGTHLTTTYRNEFTVEACTYEIADPEFPNNMLREIQKHCKYF